MRKVIQVLAQLSPTERSALVDAIDKVQDQAARAKRCILGLAPGDDVSQFMGYLDNVRHYAFVVHQAVSGESRVDRPELLTANLRWSDAYCWPRMREQLRERGIDPNRCVLADFFPYDRGLDSGLLVTSDRRIFDFQYQCVDETYAESGFTEWNELTGQYPGTDADEAIARAFTILGAG
jgi:hypothetical protein